MPENGVILSRRSVKRESNEDMWWANKVMWWCFCPAWQYGNYNQVFISKLFPYLAVKPRLKPRASGFLILKPGPSPLKAQAKPCLGLGLRGPGRAGLRALSPARHITSGKYDSGNQTYHTSSCHCTFVLSISGEQICGAMECSGVELAVSYAMPTFNGLLMVESRTKIHFSFCIHLPIIIVLRCSALCFTGKSTHRLK